MDKKTDNISVICRICLGSDAKKCMSVFEKYRDSFIVDYINSIAEVNIKNNDGLPQKICPSCLLELETAICFKQKCQSSNIILQTSLPSMHHTEGFTIKNIKKEEIQDNDAEYLLEELPNFPDPKFYDTDNPGELVSPKSRAINLNLECNECGGFFKSKCKIRVHWKKVHLPQTLICQRCKRQFKSVKAFNKHKNNTLISCTTAGSENVYVEGEGHSRVFHCKDCNYKSKRVKDMRSHILIHSGERPYTCELCPAAYTQIGSLDSHKETAHQLYKNVMTCQYCGKYIKGRRSIYKHLKKHTEKQVQCEICKKFLKSKRSLKVHMPRHMGVKNYTCEKCALTFYALSDLCNHRRKKHSHQTDVYYKCTMCEYKSKRKYYIAKHEAKHSTGHLPCTVCGMFFESEQKLIVHQNRHYSEKKHVCPHCDMKFLRRDSRNNHIRAKHKIVMVVNEKRPINFKTKNIGLSVSHEEVDIIKIEYPINS